MAAAAVGCSGGEADDIEQCAASEGEDPRMAVDTAAVDFLVEGVEDSGVVLGGFATGYDEGRSGEVELWFVLGEVLAGFVEDTRVVYGESSIDDEQQAGGVIGRGVAVDGIGEGGVIRLEHPPGEEDLVAPVDGEAGIDRFGGAHGGLCDDGLRRG